MPSPIGLKEVAPKIQGEEKWLPVVCGKCNAGCGLLIRVIDEPFGRRVVGVKGNPNYPVSQGAACPKGFTIVQGLYHPDRLKTPLKRKGPRGSGEWEPISWDEAIKEIANQLDQIRRTSPHSLAILLGPTSGLLKPLFHMFADSFGTPNIFETNWGMGEGLIDAVKVMIGTDIVYDLERTGFVISFNADWLQAFTLP
ncbi:MAG: molybdopterin-dependent oxidoreductase, partial [Candidatus Fervidibacter sp.]